MLAFVTNYLSIFDHFMGLALKWLNEITPITSITMFLQNFKRIERLIHSLPHIALLGECKKSWLGEILYIISKIMSFTDHMTATYF